MTSSGRFCTLFCICLPGELGQAWRGLSLPNFWNSMVTIFDHFKPQTNFPQDDVIFLIILTASTPKICLEASVPTGPRQFHY